ncbi:hypothetical protein [Cryptosporidium hominis TU502]|nr:hypothetical protein [Cryptosporidium hominis TU502]
MMNACFYLYIIIPLLYLTFNYQSTFSQDFSTDSLAQFSLLKLTASLGNTGSDSDGSGPDDDPPNFKPPPPPGKKGNVGSNPDGPPVPLPRTKFPGNKPPKGPGKPPVPTPRLRDLDGSDGGKNPDRPLGRRGGMRGRNGGNRQDKSSSSSSNSGSSSSPDGPVSSGGGGKGGVITVRKSPGGPPKPPERLSSLSGLLD